jgi:hypothetical protein
MTPLRLTLFALPLALGICAGCDGAGRPASERASRSVYREIQSVTIDAQAKADSGVDPQACSEFRLTDEQVLSFLKTADEVDVRGYAHDLEYAPCRAEGTLRLNNGLAAKWEIDMSGNGRVVFEDDHIMLLHCASCSGPFVR